MTLSPASRLVSLPVARVLERLKGARDASRILQLVLRSCLYVSILRWSDLLEFLMLSCWVLALSSNLSQALQLKR